MRMRSIFFSTVWVFLLVGQIERGRADDASSAFHVDLPTALAPVLQENPDV